MELILTVIISVLVVIVLGLLVWLIVSSSGNAEKMAGQQASIGLLQQQLENLKTAQDKTTEILNKSLQTGQNTINQSLQSSQKTLSELNTQIGELQGTNKQMMQMGTEIKRLQNILSSPKLRGQMGEWSLENLLSQILPKNSYKLQHALKDGRIVDALIQMPGFSVSVDAKFRRLGRASFASKPKASRVCAAIWWSCQCKLESCSIKLLISTVFFISYPPLNLPFV